MFKTELGNIKNDKLHDFVECVVNLLPDYFFEVAASSTGKYHPKYSLGEGGLVRHTKAAVKIAKDLMNLEQYRFSEDEKDVIIASLILHDGMKHGLNSSKYTVTEHPIIMAKFIRDNWSHEFSDIESQIELICGCVATHMGQFNMDFKTKKEVLAKPKSKLEQFVHLCDYLSSRKYLLVDFEDDYYTTDIYKSKNSELQDKIKLVIKMCKERVEHGYDRNKLYSIIFQYACVKNPYDIASIERADAVIEAIQNLA